MTEDQSKEEWLALRHSEAKLIDPATAEIEWSYGQILDPYGLDPHSPDDDDYCVGRVYFARRPGSDIWVCFYDLPDAVCEAMWQRTHGTALAFWKRVREAGRI